MEFPFVVVTVLLALYCGRTLSSLSSEEDELALSSKEDDGLAHSSEEDGAVTDTLPVIEISETSGYISSPNFNGRDSVYPAGYQGIFHLTAPENESLLFGFTHFRLESNCFYASVTLVLESSSQKLCGIQRIPAQIHRGQMSLYFQTEPKDEIFHTGFRMAYSIIPRRQEPQLISEGVYNCSVPYFEEFALVLRCNFVEECAGGEDERDCWYHNQECGQGMIEAGSKCWRFVRDQHMSWNDANYECLRQNQRLATMAAPEEYALFKETVNMMNFPGDIYVGLKQVDGQERPPAVAMMYKHVWRWNDRRTAFYIDMSLYDGSLPWCALYVQDIGEMVPLSCFKDAEINFVCESDRLLVNSTTTNLIQHPMDGTENVWSTKVVPCPGSHMTKDFLSCDFDSGCGASVHMASCHTGNIQVPMFQCERSLSSVHYSLVCDRVQHCPDNADEDFCHFEKCPLASLRCKNGECVSIDKFCDGKPDCFDVSDEDCYGDWEITVPTVQPPCMVDMNGHGQYTVQQLNSSADCPVTHFLCPGGLCLPVYLRCNDIDDCPGREDELMCRKYACPGFYRCRGSRVCLHPKQVCDGVKQCPHQDDELLCDLRCPDACQCQGLAFVCAHSFDASTFPDVRFLDASDSEMTLSDLAPNTFLIHLVLARCKIGVLQIPTLPNLRHLDLSWNQLAAVDVHVFSQLQNLRVLILSGNPISDILNSAERRSQNTILHTLDLSQTQISMYNGRVFTNWSSLEVINMSLSKFSEISDEGFKTTPLLSTLDTRGSHLTIFPADLLRNLHGLKTVYTDSYKLCCPAMLPADFDLNDCYAKEDPLASCEDLLKSNVYRAFLWTFAVFAIAGNVGSFVARICLEGSGLGSFGVFVTNLSLADFLMGVYLTIVGTADFIYRGEYLFHDLQWKKSAACRVAGFLSLLSSEVSAFNICMITVDRFLVLRFPFSRAHFSRRSALVACLVVWAIGLVIATIPLLPGTSHWKFGHSGICIPLPFTSSTSMERFPGYAYSFTVMIVLNFILFVLIACGQVVIYWSVRATSITAANRDTNARDKTIARRLITVAMSDFLCWFPVGVLGMLASAGTVIPGELNVAVAVLVLPVNSALNPFLYTLNVVMEKRDKAREKQLLKKLETRIFMAGHVSDNATVKTKRESVIRDEGFDKANAIKTIREWLHNRMITTEEVTSCLCPADIDVNKKMNGETP